MQFSELGLNDLILSAVAKQGYTKATPIQAQAIPAILAGQDLFAAAQTGTGKTAAFTLPLLQSLLPFANNSVSPARHPLRALILTPTRELADQVAENVRAYSVDTTLRSAVVFGGVDIQPQITALRAGVELLIATPGRLLDHVQQKTLNLATVQFLVLDEADRMLDMGFMPDILRILPMLVQRQQTLLFSATFAPEIKRLAKDFMRNPQVIEVARQNSTNEMVEQRIYSVASAEKRKLLSQLVRGEGWTQVLVFTRTRLGADRLARELLRDGLKVEAIHGDRSQQARMQALELFKQGSLQILVATDIAARGLDINELPFVVNFDLPTTPEDYVHRIGRTGRGGKTGIAVSLVAPEERASLEAIEKLIAKKLPLLDVPNFKPVDRLSRQDSASQRARSNQTREDVHENTTSLPRADRDWMVKDEHHIPIKLSARKSLPSLDLLHKHQLGRKQSEIPALFLPKNNVE